MTAPWMPPQARYTSDSMIDSMHAYGLACARAALEQAAKVCESRQTPGTGSVAILNGAADAIRALAKEITP